MTHNDHKALTDFVTLPTKEMEARAKLFYEQMKRRHSLRHFSSQSVPRSIIEDCLKAAGTAPNGANMQPWHFAVVSSPEIKKAIREAAEKEEQAFYQQRASEEWLAALAPLGTDASKPFLETAPYLIVIFKQDYGLGDNGERIKHYYVQESVGIATGVLITALHFSGLATLTHTPSPMNFLREILRRPANERAEMILVVGYPSEDAQIPNITKKPLDKIASFH